jgi:3-oxoacyl-[acyl-carrier protein] reductase
MARDYKRRADVIDLTGKVALITGGSRGIGAAAALRFADAGASLAITYVMHEAEAARVADAIRERGVRALAIRTDVSRREEVERLFQATLDEFERLDIVVANAGIWKRGPIDQLDEESWDETIDVNLKGVYHCCAHAARVFKPQRSGTIVTVSSTAGQRGEAFHSHYAASKGGVISLTKSLATELGPYGIRVNCVAPGWVDTDMSAELLRIPAELRKIEAGIPLGRVATADDCAGPILFLASDLAGQITGEVLNVNGGSVLCG